MFISADDKAIHEAEMFVPEIESVTIKYGTGLESARHRDVDTVLTEIRETAARAARRVKEIHPFEGFEPPHELVVRYRDRPDDDVADPDNVERVDPYTVRVTGETLRALHGDPERL